MHVIKSVSWCLLENKSGASSSELRDTLLVEVPYSGGILSIPDNDLKLLVTNPMSSAITSNLE